MRGTKKLLRFVTHDHAVFLSDFQIEQSLRSIEHKMAEAIDFSMKIIKMCHSLTIFDSFYRRSLKSLVAVLETVSFTSNFSTHSIHSETL